MTISDLSVFEFGKKKVRTAGNPDEPLFCAADVCGVLEVADVSSALERLDQDEIHIVAKKGSQRILYAGPNANAYVTESGLFALMMTSRKPEAKAFRKWVTSEVLPAIRRRGVYSLAEAMGRKALIDECFRELPSRQATLFDPLIDALRKFANPSAGGTGGTPPWARLIACWIYEWTWKEHKSELRKRNKVQDDGSLIWRDYETLTDEGRRLVSITIGMAVFAARESTSWQQWREKMEAYFAGQNWLPFPSPPKQLGGKRRKAA